MLPIVVTYALNDSTKVRFEIDPPAGFQEAGADRVIGRVQDALAPAIETAKLILDKLKEAKPGEVTVTFGLKVSGKLDWFVARAGTEGNFQITMTWQPGESEGLLHDLRRQLPSSAAKALTLFWGIPADS